MHKVEGIPDYESLARRAERQAALAESQGVADGWRNLAETYRQLALGHEPKGTAGLSQHPLN